VVHVGAGERQYRSPTGRQHPHALALEYSERRHMHVLDLIVREYPDRLEGVYEVAVACGALRLSDATRPRGVSPARSHLRAHFSAVEMASSMSQRIHALEKKPRPSCHL